MIAAFAMSMSSIFVVMNVLRLGRFKEKLKTDKKNNYRRKSRCYSYKVEI